MAEKAGIAGNDLQLLAGAMELDGTLEEFNHASSDLEKRVQPAMESAGLKWFPA